MIKQVLTNLSFRNILIFNRSITTTSKSTKIGIIGCGNVGRRRKEDLAKKRELLEAGGNINLKNVYVFTSLVILRYYDYFLEAQVPRYRDQTGWHGNAVANNLLRNGFAVTGMYDLENRKMDEMPGEIRVCSSPKEVVQLSDVCITGLPRPANVLSAADGPDGILAGLDKDKIWIDHSTTDYEQTLEFSKKARQVGAHVLEAPITGGLVALQKGQMIVHTGGDKEISEAVKPILEASYKEIFYVGEIGSAMIVKVVSNMLATLNAIAAGEVLLLAKRANINLPTFFDAIRASAGNSFAWETCVPLILNGQYDPGFTMELLCKDLQLGYDLGRKFKVPLDLNQLALAISRRAQYEFGDSTGCYSQPKSNELVTGESLRHPKFKEWTYDNEIIDGSIHVKHVFKE